MKYKQKFSKKKKLNIETIWKNNIKNCKNFINLEKV